MRGPLNDVVARGAAREFRDFLKRVGHQLSREQFTALGEEYLKSASDRVRPAHLNAAQRRAYVLADNKLALNAGWDSRKTPRTLEHA